MRAYEFRSIVLGEAPNVSIAEHTSSPALRELMQRTRAQIMKHVGFSDDHTARYAWFSSAEVELLAGYAAEVVSAARESNSRLPTQTSEDLSEMLGEQRTRDIQGLIAQREVSDAALLYEAVSMKKRKHPAACADAPKEILEALDFAILAAHALKQLDEALVAQRLSSDAASLIADAALAVTYATICQPFIDLDHLEALPAKVASDKARAAVKVRDINLPDVINATIEKYKKENLLPNGRIRTAYKVSNSEQMQEFVRTQLKRNNIIRRGSLQRTIYKWLHDTEKSINKS